VKRLGGDAVAAGLVAWKVGGVDKGHLGRRIRLEGGKGRSATRWSRANDDDIENVRRNR
jgi:hypothetical protein